jgi:hypothetical protein
LILIALIIFIAQNAGAVQVSFVSLHGRFSLAVALLAAVAAGCLLTLVLGNRNIRSATAPILLGPVGRITDDDMPTWRRSAQLFGPSHANRSGLPRADGFAEHTGWVCVCSLRRCDCPGPRQ